MGNSRKTSTPYMIPPSLLQLRILEYRNSASEVLLHFSTTFSNFLLIKYGSAIKTVPVKPHSVTNLHVYKETTDFSFCISFHKQIPPILF